jgi:hypothetical protein
MNKLFIDNESFDIDEDDITMSQIKNRIYVNGKLISEVNNDSVHVTLMETLLLYMVIVSKLKVM